MGLLKQIFREFSDDKCTTLAASLSYYTVFALPPLLYLLVMILTFALSLNYEGDEAENRARMLIERQVGDLLGNQSVSDEVATILESTRQKEGKLWRSLVSIFGILLGATGVVAALQASLNQVWQVRVDPKSEGFSTLIKQRVLSLAMILGLGFLLLVSLILSSVASAASQQLDGLIGVEGVVPEVMNHLVQAVIIFCLLAAILRYMPDARVHWKDVAVGAATTTSLFLVGRILIQLYFSYSPPGEGLESAAASLMAVLVWVYYSSLILLLGAEATQVIAKRSGREISPKTHAVRIVEKLEAT